MKIKRLLVTTSFIFLAATTAFTITDATSKKITKIIIEDNEKDLTTPLSIIAHRGFSSLELENSEDAIELGFSVNYTSGVEIDVRLTKDEQVVLSHNEEINDKKIKDSTLEELQKETIKKQNFSDLTLYLDSLLDGMSGDLIRDRIKILQEKESKIITLEDALKIHDQYQDKTLIIELKFDERDKDTFSDIVYEKLKDHNAKNIIIQSNDYESLLKMKNKYPELEYHLIIKKDNYDFIKNQDLDGYVIRKNLINYDDIKELIDNDKKVSIWTINSYSEYANINSILNDLNTKISYITDYPDALRTWRNIKEENATKQKIKK